MKAVFTSELQVIQFINGHFTEELPKEFWTRFSKCFKVSDGKVHLWFNRKREWRSYDHLFILLEESEILPQYTIVDPDRFFKTFRVTNYQLLRIGHGMVIKA